MAMISRLHYPQLILAVVLVVVLLGRPLAVLADATCGKWQSTLVTPKDLRLKVTGLGPATGDRCQGGFVFANQTGVLGIGGYTLDLQAQGIENVVNEWTLGGTLTPESYVMPSMRLVAPSFAILS